MTSYDVDLIPLETVHSDITVVGGGLAGVCAALAAARQGMRVSLVQNRPVLGGNSSSEVRVWVCGATAHGVQHYARETGIMGELFVENQFTNPEGNPYYWDLVLLEAVRAESGIELFLNTDVRDVEAEGPLENRQIRSVSGWQMGSERRLQFRSTMYIDASGDGLVGFLAGARYRTGRESREEYQESWAPVSADAETLGSTILFYVKDVGYPVKYVPPSFARDITETSIPTLRDIHKGANGCDYWWIEWGGDRDVVAHNEEIRDELQAAIYGIWDYLKNSGKFDADNLTLEWIGAVPGKREYRRFLGDHVLTQHDVLDQTPFEDRVAFGGWSIDLHPPGGMYATEKGSRHWHPDGNYHIPLRSLYSQNVSNMWMAGRNISATHVAFGSTRVMATCGVIGEAAGLGAALSAQQGCTPRELASEHLDEVRRAIVRTDASVLGVRHDDPTDHALAARITATSQLTGLGASASSGRWELISSLGVVVPVDPALEGIELLIDAERDTELTVDVHEVGRPQNYVPHAQVAGVCVQVTAGTAQWITVPVRWQPSTPQNAFLVLHANSHIAVHTSPGPLPGVVALTYRELSNEEPYTEQWRAWKQVLHRTAPCLRLATATGAFAAEKAVGGYSRPWAGPQMWISEPLTEDPEPQLHLAWDPVVSIGEVAVIFDDDLDEDLINLHHHRTPFDVLPTLVSDYRIEVVDEAGTSTVIADVTANRMRHRRHRLPQPVAATSLRLVVTGTNGVPQARVVSLRAWAAEE
ncbi:FAD-dependent oxidoreductase [Ruania halotolerans]|uniref:FAD-dependent oxidoreductase n=1 Tax=Ruania halotolerans TaxID=2897773 RepID=UPI001E5366CC|nr:FAD-dependent oxidoreductase [Ruania halotolerans]UFU07002.1 FAD-dependent oxidoreductase [Ruania halotolerans]